MNWAFPLARPPGAAAGLKWDGSGMAFEDDARFVLVIERVDRLFRASWELRRPEGRPMPARRSGNAIFRELETAVMWGRMEAARLGFPSIEIIDRTRSERDPA